MNKISEQKALEAYPQKYDNLLDTNVHRRIGYRQGYEQAIQDILEGKKILLKPNDMNNNDMTNEQKAKEIVQKFIPNDVYDTAMTYIMAKLALLQMAQWKDEQLNSLKDEIQSNLCASSGFNDEYSRGYQDCGMKVMEMIDKILEL